MQRLSSILASLLGAAALSLGASASIAHAQDVYTVAAQTCTMSSTDAAKVSLNYGGVRFAGTNTGSVVLWCPIPAIPVASFVDALELVYTDSDATGTAARVSAELMRQLDTSGFVDVASISSNSFAGTGAQVQYVSFGHSFDPYGNSYVARVVLYRGTTSQAPEFRAIRITVGPPM